MDWPRFVRAWAYAHDGFDLRHAGHFARWWARVAYRCGSKLIRIGAGPAAVTVTGLVAAVFVPLITAGGGRWPLLAALLVGVGLLAEASSCAVSVLLDRTPSLDGFYRALSERAAELCWLLAAALLGASTVLVVACGILAAVHEYVRSRAIIGGLRAAGTGTIGDRPLRIASTLVLLVLAALLGPVAADLPAGTSTLVLALWALLAIFGLVQLIAVTRKALAR